LEPLPDLAALSDDDLKQLINDLTREENEVSYQRRLLHGKIDILRAGTTSYGRRRKRRLGAGSWPEITRRQSPPSPLARLSGLAAVECGIWLGARDPEARRHYWKGH